ESVFKLKLSNETLRRLVGELKQLAAARRARASEQEVATTADDLPQTDQACLEGQGVSGPTKETACDCSVAEFVGSTEVPAPSAAMTPESSLLPKLESG